MPIKVLTFQYNRLSGRQMETYSLLQYSSEVFVLPNKILIIYSTAESFQSTFSQIKKFFFKTLLSLLNIKFLYEINSNLIINLIKFEIC